MCDSTLSAGSDQYPRIHALHLELVGSSLIDWTIMVQSIEVGRVHGFHIYKGGYDLLSFGHLAQHGVEGSLSRLVIFRSTAQTYSKPYGWHY